MGSFSNKNRQSGAATIMFLLMVPVLIGFMALSIEGGRYMRTKASVVDSAEVASLVLSATAAEDSYSDSSLIKNYVDQLVPEAKDNQILVSISSPPALFDAEEGFIEYQVKVKSTHESWFPKWSDDGMGFDKEVTLTGTASARKYFGISGGLDVVFVPNFSHTQHGCDWDKCKTSTDPSWQKNIDLIKEAIEEIVMELQAQSADSSQNYKYALVPFNYVTFEKTNDPANNPCLIRQQLDGSSAGKTIEHLFTEKECSTDLEFDISKADYGSFHTIPLTDNAKQMIAEMEPMKGGWNAASFEGVIRAGQIAAQGDNKNRLIIVISTSHDGNKALPLTDNKGNKADESPDKFHDLLNESPGYCNTMLETLSSQKTSSGDSVTAKIVGIGFDDNIMGSHALRNCIGKDSLIKHIKPKDDELSEAIRAFILDFSDYEEIGRIHKS